VTAKILQVVGSLTVGGAERVALELAAGLASRGWTMGLLAADPDTALDESLVGRSLRTEADERGVTVHRVPFAGIGDGPGRARMARFLVDSGVQLLHIHNRPQDWQIVTLAALLGIPAIYSTPTPRRCIG
jgi:hypothetical protein